MGDGKSGEGDKLRLKEFECDRSTSYVFVLKYVSASCFIGSSYCTAIYVSSGNCQFRAVADQLFGSQDEATSVSVCVILSFY